MVYFPKLSERHFTRGIQSRCHTEHSTHTTNRTAHHSLAEPDLTVFSITTSPRNPTMCSFITFVVVALYVLEYVTEALHLCYPFLQMALPAEIED